MIANGRRRSSSTAYGGLASSSVTPNRRPPAFVGSGMGTPNGRKGSSGAAGERKASQLLVVSEHPEEEMMVDDY